MSSQKISIDTEKIKELAIKMHNLSIQEELACKNASNGVILVNKNFKSFNSGLDRRMSVLIKDMCDLLEQILKDSYILDTAVEAFESDNAQLINDIEKLEDIAQTKTEEYWNRTTDLGQWSKNANDAEYALLSGIWSDVSKSDDPILEFKKRLMLELPDNDPLNQLKMSYCKKYDSISGLQALVMTDSNGNATVIFAGTNGDLGDIAADTDIALSLPTFQESEALDIINDLSKEYSNITVTGHSLGGYLATYVALHNPYVSKCLAFDPPGQNISALNGYDHGQIKTYVTQGIINKAGHIHDVGERVQVDVKWQPTDDNGHLALDRMAGHNINDICEAIGGKESIETQWNNYAEGIETRIHIGGSGGSGR